MDVFILTFDEQHMNDSHVEICGVYSSYELAVGAMMSRIKGEMKALKLDTDRNYLETDNGNYKDWGYTDKDFWYYRDSSKNYFICYNIVSYPVE